MKKSIITNHVLSILVMIISFTFFRACVDHLLCPRLDFPLELLTDGIGLSGLFIISRNPLVDVNIAIRALFTPLANVSFSRYWLRYGVYSFLTWMP